jgi:hypothetical protein
MEIFSSPQTTYHKPDPAYSPPIRQKPPAIPVINTPVRAIYMGFKDSWESSSKAQMAFPVLLLLQAKHHHDRNAVRHGKAERAQHVDEDHPGIE